MVEIDARQRLKILIGGVSLLALGNCGGGGSNTSTPTPTPTPTTPTPVGYQPTSGLFRNQYRNNFKIGSSVQTFHIQNSDPLIDVLKDQFSSMLAEYEMKPDSIAPTEGSFDFSTADTLVQFAEDNGLDMQGHTLLWHQSTPDYFFQGSKDQIKARLQNYVTEVVSRYRDRISVWHVVNEVISDADNGPAGPYRNSNWYQAVGSGEFIDWAFEAARAADPNAQLLINEYNTEFPDKRGRLLQVVQDLLDRNIPIDGVGHQCHLDLNDSAESVFAAIDAVDDLFAGLVNHITELDMSVYSDPGSCWETQTNCDTDYGDNLPESISKQQAQTFRDIFNGLILRPSVETVSFWGISDKTSWLNTIPTTRTNYPLLFDRDVQAKPSFRAIVDRFYEI